MQTHDKVMQVAQALIAGRADIDLADARGRTPLFWAGYNGNVPLINVLAGSVDKNPSDQYQVTVLNYAVQRGLTDAAAALIRIGADPKLGDSMGGHNALMEAERSTDNKMRALFNLSMYVPPSPPSPSTGKEL